MKNISNYSINYHGSDPRLELDQCWDGADFSTLKEACTAFSRPSADHVAECPFQTGGELWVELAQGTRTNEGLASLKTLRVRCLRKETATDRTAAAAADERADRDEYAQQQGMAFGVEAHNDALL